MLATFEASKVKTQVSVEERSSCAASRIPRLAFSSVTAGAQFLGSFKRLDTCAKS